MAMAATAEVSTAISTTNIAGGVGPAYVICALPYRADVDGESQWGLDTALAIVEEAVVAFDPPRIEPRRVRERWPEQLRESAKVTKTMSGTFLGFYVVHVPST